MALAHAAADLGSDLGRERRAGHQEDDPAVCLSPGCEDLLDSLCCRRRYLGDKESKRPAPDVVCSRDEGPEVERTFEPNLQGLSGDVATRLREGLIEVDIRSFPEAERIVVAAIDEDRVAHQKIKRLAEAFSLIESQAQHCLTWPQAHAGAVLREQAHGFHEIAGGGRSRGRDAVKGMVDQCPATGIGASECG